MTNLYWSVYKSLEKELIMLSNQIHFDDSQLSVYSVKISELLLRSVVEIESISKDLYFKLGGELPSKGDLYFDTHCIELLENTWLLSKKQVIISSQNFYFSSSENRILTPLKKANKRGISSSDWKKAYQSVKHNRVRNLVKGNVKNLIRSMAALYLLNIYLKSDEFDLQKDSQALNFNESLGSDVFSIKIHISTSVSADGSYTKNKDFDECTYFTRATEETNKIFNESIKNIEKKHQELTSNHFVNIIQTELKKRADITNENIQEIVEREKKNIGNKFLLEAARSQKPEIEQLRYEAILNKNQI